MFKIVLVAIAAFYFTVPAHATTVGITNVPAYAYVGTEYVEMPNKMMVIRDIYVPNLSNSVCTTLAASYVTAGFVTIRFPDGQNFISKKTGTCVQMFNPVADNLL